MTYLDEVPFQIQEVSSSYPLGESCYGMDIYQDFAAFVGEFGFKFFERKKQTHKMNISGTRVKFYNNGKHIIILVDNLGPVIFKTKKFQKVKEFNLGISSLNNWSCCFTKDERYFICGYFGTVIVIDLPKLEIVFQKKIHQKNVLGISLYENEVLTSSLDQDINRLDLEKMKITGSFHFNDELYSVLNYGDHFYVSQKKSLLKCDRSGNIIEEYLSLEKVWCIQNFGSNYLAFIHYSSVKNMLRFFDLKEKKVILEEYLENNSSWDLHITRDRVYICMDVYHNDAVQEFEYKFEVDVLNLSQKIQKLYDTRFIYK